ncbi:uncharacterized protein LOC129177364 isoform X2 [Dunckerocampus dactyliophorus]|uniref:uncharacterized protein LOC129177364 isoform X2 n=1 Tax=Dunckerocampus dactyliophorus TaxID=161453 RepID=UPI0024051F1D|nr:uncharacterized protein LOC129177364 isoform X2 [Dunckerocampus dactyliophorus]
MPGKCKFQESWLSKDIYKEWLLKDTQDIHFARCKACCKSIKLQTMGEAALTSHAGGAGHKAAVRKLVEGNLRMIHVAGQMNGSLSWTEDSKEHVAISLQHHDLDRVAGNDWAEMHHSPKSNSRTSLNAELQDASFASTYFTAAGTSSFHSQRLVPLAGSRSQDAARDPLENQQRAEVLEQQQQQMRLLEWESRMKVLAWEQELIREKTRVARQKEKAFRMKKNYYKAKLKRMGEDVPPSSPGSSDDDDEERP